MNVIIGTQHKELVEELIQKVVIEERSENTSHFRITKSRFEVLVQKIRERGYNPYTILWW